MGESAGRLSVELVDRITSQVHSRGNAVAIRSPGREITCLEFGTLVNQLAHRLRGAEVEMETL
jgi:hypothetical protein